MEKQRHRRQRWGERSHRLGLLPSLQWMRRWLRNDIRILAYHRVLDVPDPDAFTFDLDLVSASVEQFRKQVRWLRRHFVLLSLGEVLDAMDCGRRVPANAVVLTFDDGYDDNYHHAFPILRETDVPATFFVATGFIERGVPFAYDWFAHMISRTSAVRLHVPELDLDLEIPSDRAGRQRLSHRVLHDMKSLADVEQQAAIERLEREWNMPRSGGHPDCQPMSWAQLREMQAAGMEVGSHGVRHRMLAKLPQEDMESELRHSKETLERELGTPVTLLSYPVGGHRAFDERVMAAAEATGYRGACCYLSGTNPVSASTRYALRRLPVESEMGSAWFAAAVTVPEVFGYRTPLNS